MTYSNTLKIWMKVCILCFFQSSLDLRNLTRVWKMGIIIWKFKICAIFNMQTFPGWKIAFIFEKQTLFLRHNSLHILTYLHPYLSHVFVIIWCWNSPNVTFCCCCWFLLIFPKISLQRLFDSYFFKKLDRKPLPEICINLNVLFQGGQPTWNFPVFSTIIFMQ